MTMRKTTTPASHAKGNAKKEFRIAKGESARVAIGELQKGTDLFILTYGQFSLIDALVEILRQTGPAHVSISTWTAAHAHLDRSAELMDGLGVLSFRMIVDRSFRTRQPAYHARMVEIFGTDSIRAIRTHAKFMLIRNESWDIVVRTSMNLNENPRLENIEISDNEGFADFFQGVVDAVFDGVSANEELSDIHDLALPIETKFKLVRGNQIERSGLNEPTYTHTVSG